MKNLLSGLACTLLLSTAAGADDFRCFTSVGLKKPIRLQFIYQTDTDGVGYVRYERGSGAIEVTRTGEEELQRGPEGRPSEFAIEWQDIVAKGTGGSYRMVSQGALISEFSYRRPDGKTFRFEETPNAMTDNGCDWSLQ